MSGNNAFPLILVMHIVEYFIAFSPFVLAGKWLNELFEVISFSALAAFAGFFSVYSLFNCF